MPRIIFDGDEKTSNQLTSVADNLDLSKVRAMKLAVSVLHELSKELGAGAELVIRKNGSEKGLWLPFVGKHPAADNSAEATNTARPRKQRSPRS